MCSLHNTGTCFQLTTELLKHIYITAILQARVDLISITNSFKFLTCIEDVLVTMCD